MAFTSYTDRSSCFTNIFKTRVDEESCKEFLPHPWTGSRYLEATLIHYDGDTFIRAVRNILKYNLKPIHNEQASSIIPSFYSDMSGMQFQ